MAKKAHDTRSNVLIKRGGLPAQRKVVDDRAFKSLKRKAERLGLILRDQKKGGRK